MKIIFYISLANIHILKIYIIEKNYILLVATEKKEFQNSVKVDSRHLSGIAMNYKYKISILNGKKNKNIRKIKENIADDYFSCY